MARWTQPHEIREYGRVLHAFIDAMANSRKLLVIPRQGRPVTGQLDSASTHQEPTQFPPAYAGEFTLRGDQGELTTFDILDVKDVFPLFTPQEAAALIP